MQMARVLSTVWAFDPGAATMPREWRRYEIGPNTFYTGSLGHAVWRRLTGEDTKKVFY